MVPVNAPYFDVLTCRNAYEQAVIEALHARAEAAGLPIQLWMFEDTPFLIAWMEAASAETPRQLVIYRADFRGDRVLMGRDRTGNFESALEPADPQVRTVCGPPVQLAQCAADWFALLFVSTPPELLDPPTPEQFDEPQRTASRYRLPPVQPFVVRVIAGVVIAILVSILQAC